MKKTICLVLVLLLCAALTAFAETDTGSLLLRIYNANTADAIRANHESRIVHIKEKDRSDCAEYQDANYEISYNPDFFKGVRARTSEYDYVAPDEGGFWRFITYDDRDPWQFYSERLLKMELVSVEEEGDALVVTVRSPENFAVDFYPEAVETMEEHVVDGETMELRSYRAWAVLPDGSEGTVFEQTIGFDVERAFPEVIEAIENHLSEEHDTRTTTFIFDDGKPCKRTYVYETPVGDGCISNAFEENGYRYEIDMERSEPSNDALDNDAVYYMVRVKPEA